MKRWVLGIVVLLCVGSTLASPSSAAAVTEKRVYVLPIRDNIEPPLTYVVRRGVKEAMEARAELLVLDMETDGGRLDVTEEIIGILSKFPGETVTYVNRKAFSAGAFIAVATQKIYMAEEAVIGAATPLMVVPGGGPMELPASVEAKMNSGVKALIRAKAEKNGHNVEVIEAMIDRNKELIMDGVTINPKGQILTLTSSEAARTFGDPPRALLSSGTFPSLEGLLDELGFRDAQRTDVRPTGVERIAFWLNTISPLLLAIGLIGIYMEFKTPGFGIPGMIAVVALLLYFVGGYVAGLSGIEWVAVFAMGVVLIALEVFLFPGTMALGIAGSLFVLISLIMAATDLYPGTPAVPTLPQLRLPIVNLAIAGFIAALGVWILGMLLPKTSAYHVLVSQGTSGGTTDSRRSREQRSQMGREGVAISVLRPGGKARFGEEILDVVTLGEMLPPGAPVRIIGHSAREAVVEPVTQNGR